MWLNSYSLKKSCKEYTEITTITSFILYQTSNPNHLIQPYGNKSVTFKVVFSKSVEIFLFFRFTQIKKISSVGNARKKGSQAEIHPCLMKSRLMRFVTVPVYWTEKEERVGRFSGKSIEGLRAQRKRTGLETLSTSREKASRVWLLSSFPLLSHSHETFTRPSIILLIILARAKTIRFT